MKTIAILTQRIDTFSNPTLTLIFEKLIERDYKILFFGYEQIFMPRQIKKRIEYHQLPFAFYRMKKKPGVFIKYLKQAIRVYNLLKVENKVDKMICVDPMGLVIAGRIQRLINLKIIYASFEIFSEDEFYIQEKKILKDLEKKYSEKVSAVIIQDWRREKLLKEVNNFREKAKYFRIPVSPKAADKLPEEIDIYRSLNIPKDKKIIVYSGTMQSWSGVNELLDLFPENWDSDYWLVIHSHQKLEEDNELVKRIKELTDSKQPFSFHNEPFFDLNEYASFLSKCYAGIATYFPNTNDIFAGKNLQMIGLSSGKFSTYMMLGIPAITTSNEIYKELNDEYNFGEIIGTMSEIPEAIKKIGTDYKNKSEGCMKLYKKVLDPEERIENLINEIEKDKFTLTE